MRHLRRTESLTRAVIRSPHQSCSRTASFCPVGIGSQTGRLLKGQIELPTALEDSTAPRTKVYRSRLGIMCVDSAALVNPHDADQFIAPPGVIFDQRGHLFVVDAYNHSIQKFDVGAE